MHTCNVFNGNKYHSNYYVVPLLFFVGTMSFIQKSKSFFQAAKVKRLNNLNYQEDQKRDTQRLIQFKHQK